MDKLHSGGHFLKWSHRTPRDACYFSVVSHLLDFFFGYSVYEVRWKCSIS